MADYCKECYKNIMAGIPAKNYCMSKEYDICERCGRVTNVVIGVTITDQYRRQMMERAIKQA